MTRNRWWLLPLAAVAAWCQQPTPPGVTGSVVNALSNEPIARAHVVLQARGEKTAKKYGAITTAAGKYSIVPVPPGEYEVTVERPGFLPAPNQLGITYISVTVKEHDPPIDLPLKLLPQAVIVGRVLDADGNPVERIGVSTASGRSNQSADTNVRGEFRLSGLRPGRYLIRAAPPEGGPPETRSDGTKEINYGVTWYPANPDERGATVVVARAGVETAGIDIHLLPTTVVRVSGVIAALPAGAKDYVLGRESGPGFRESRTTGMLTSTRFTLWRLSPGRYRLTAWCRTPAGTVTAAPVEVEVGDRNIDNIELRFVPPFAVKGKIEGDLPAHSDGQSKKPTLKLQPIGKNPEATKPAEIAEDGTFQIEKVHPDRYRVVVDGLPANLYIQSVHLGNVEAANGVVDWSAGVSGAALEVRLGTASGRVSGTVQAADGPALGWMVAILPDETYGFDRMRTVAVDSAGKYAFDGVPAGSYRVFAFDPADLPRLKEGIGIEWYEKSTEKVEVSEGGSAVTDLKPDTGN